MSRIAIALAVTLVVASSGCDRSPARGDAAANSSPAGGSRPAAALVERARIDSCAGFTAEKAAELLGVEAGTLETRNAWSEEMGGQICRYWSRESLIGPGVQFLIEPAATAAEAASRLASLRRDAPAGEAAIRDAFGKATPGKALVVFEGIGDEAMWDPLTTGVSLRVGNAIASIKASPSRSLAAHKAEDTIELERRVAEEVARGLRAP
jgi:hypothetical protein